MHLLLHKQCCQVLCLFFILIALTLSVPVKESIVDVKCNGSYENCTSIRQNISSDSSSLSSSSSSSSSLPTTSISTINLPYSTSNSTQQRVTSRTRHRTFPWSTRSTTSYRLSTTSRPLSDLDSFSDNLKRAALILAGIALGLGMLRICLMLCKSRSSTEARRNRHSSAAVRPQLSTIEHHQFKPDLPPAYIEAIANRDNEGGKLPSYDELPIEQQQHYASNMIAADRS